MSTRPRGKLVTSVILGGATLAIATVGLRAFSDVPRGALPLGPISSPTLNSETGNAGVGSRGSDGSRRSDDELLTRASHAFNEIAHKAMPAVVSITTVRRAPHRHRSGPGAFPSMPPGLGGPLDEDLPDLADSADPADSPRDSDDEDLTQSLAQKHWKHSPSPHGPRSPLGGLGNQRMFGIGSGIIIRKDGMILTNNHVIEEAEKILVTLDEKHKIKAHLIGADPKTDLALIQLDGPKREDYSVIPFGDSDQIREGDWAIAIGSPFGLNRSVSFGIISAKGRAQMGILDIEDFIQTDAAINPGSSGGPLLNARGELVGVNTAIFSEGGGNMGIGFAVPAKIAHEISDALLAQGHVSRGWMGMMAQDLDPDLAHYFKVPSVQGALISQVAPLGPASNASLQGGDVITQFDHQRVDGAATLKSLVGKSKAGNVVPLDIIRNGQAQMVKVTIREQPDPVRPKARVVQQAGQLARTHRPSFGVAVEDVPVDISRFLHLQMREGTMVVGVNPGSPAFDAGIGPGDIILSANHAEVHGAHDFARISKELGGKNDQDIAVLFIQRGPTERIFVPVKLREPST